MIAAGGDGTVGRVALQLVDSGVPLAVIPLGTANNLARSLGFVGSPQEIIASLENGRKCAFDIGIARGPWGKQFLFEGAGGGLLADYLRTARDTARNGKRVSKNRKCHGTFRYCVRPYRITGPGNGKSASTARRFPGAIYCGRR